jgi:NitT/TauT family transport system substrate-binding protein
MRKQMRLIQLMLCGVLFMVFGTSALIADSKTAKPLQTVKFGVSYIPNVQFAPLYISQQKGFYAEEGLAVELQYGYESDFVTLAAQGTNEFAVASGDQIILARSQGIPITYIMKWYQRYPVGLMIPSSKKIATIAGLKGKQVGLPGFFGATYIGWKALLYNSGLNESEVVVKQIGFNQAAAVQQNMVDAAMVYIVNEPIQLRAAGIGVNVIEVSDSIDLVSNGLAVGDKLMKSDPDLVQRMVRATLRGLIYAVNHPDEAFAISRQAIPEITDKTAPMQRKVLNASLELWKADKYGVSTRKSWQESVDFMQKTGLLKRAVDVDTLYTNKFIENP